MVLAKLQLHLLQLFFISLFFFGNADKNISNKEHGKDPVELYTACTKDALVVSEIFCLHADYRKDVPPPMNGPINVFFKLPVSEISKIDDQRSQISLRWTYKLKWQEPRMILNTSADWSRGEINVRGDMINNFWTPDVIIHDLVNFNKPEILNQVAALEIKDDLQLYYKVRSDMTMVCKGMKFHRFPLDEHICYLKLTSFGYDDTRMMLRGKFSYNRDNQRALPFNVHIKKLPRELTTFAGSSSNYSVYGMEIKLSRCVSPYLLNVYLPTAIFVVMSWVSFLIPTDVVPARIVLLVTLCLVIINTFNNVTARIPVASQVTALEIWLLACILLVFGALAEYAFILRQVIKLSRQQQRMRNHFNLQMKNNSDANSHPDLPQQLDVFSPNAGLLSQGQREALGAAETDLGQELGNGQDDLDEREFEPYEIEKRDSQGHNSRKWFSSCPRWRAKSRPNNQEEMSDIHYIPDPNMDQTIESMNQIPPNSTTANNSNSKIRFLMPKFGARKEKDHLKDRRPSKTLDQLMRRYQEHVDANALIVFPIAFLFFNIGYWVHYLIFRQQT